MTFFAHNSQVIDRPVTALPGATSALLSTQETVIFTPPREIHRCIEGDLVGRLDNYLGEVLCRLTADDEFRLQLTLSETQLAFESSTRPKGTVGFLGIIIYGPKGLSSDLSRFIAKCGYYLDDPIDCDRNVPYMNPHSLVSFYDEPSMTFDLPQARQQSPDDLMRTPLDILAGFETTGSLPESVTPSALCTDLKVYVRLIRLDNISI